LILKLNFRLKGDPPLSRDFRGVIIITFSKTLDKFRTLAKEKEKYTPPEILPLEISPNFSSRRKKNPKTRETQ